MLRKLLCGGVLAASLVLASNAAAATVTIGATAPPGTYNGGGCSGCADFQTSTDPAGPGYAVPAGDGGVITSWSVVSGTSGSTCSSECGAQLLVLRPKTPGDYIFAGESTFESPPDDGSLHTYSTDIAVDPGDVIGLVYYNVVAYFNAAEPMDDQTQAADCTFTVGLDGCGGLPATNGSLMSVAATIQTPSAAFTPSTTSVADGGSVNFNGSASTTAATSITDYDWNFGDGTTLDSGTTATASHAFATPGPHTVTLTVTNSYGATGQATKTVTVLAPFAGSSLTGTTLSASAAGKVTFDVRCSATAATSCTDSVTLFASSGALPATAATAHQAKAATRLGSASFTIASGRTAVEHLTLDAAGGKLLAGKRFSARVLISAGDGAGRHATTSAHVTIKLTATASAHHAPLAGLLASWLAAP